MRLEFGTKIELQREICQICDSVRFVRFAGVRFVRFVKFVDFHNLKKMGDPRMDGRTDPLIEMRGRI